MAPFVIVADLRTGSTLLSTSLNEHPQVRCYGELFHPEDLPDNRPPGPARSLLSGRDLIRQVFTVKGLAAVGFRAMIFLPTPQQPQWADAWNALQAIDALRVITLIRRDWLAQYASVRIAQETGVWHPSPDRPPIPTDRRPSLVIPPAELQQWILERQTLFRQRCEQLAGKPLLELDYETLTSEWPNAIRNVQEFLGVPLLPLPAAKHKQEMRPLSQVVLNYDELAHFLNQGS